MAGNFWRSSHYSQWVMDRQDILKVRNQDLQSSKITEPDYQKIMIFFANVIQSLGESLKMRQQVIATATVYFKRFYAKHSLKSVDPFLLAPTSLFLASKVEEFGVISNNRIISTFQSVLKSKFSYAYPQEYQYKINQVLECEFLLLEVMDCSLILYHPYRPLMQYIADMRTGTGEEKVLQGAWRIINDTLRTDIPLLYPPFLVALAGLQIACVIHKRDAKGWFAELNVDMDKVLEITRQILALYDLWQNYDEKSEILGILNKIPKIKVSSQPSSQPNEAQLQQQ